MTLQFDIVNEGRIQKITCEIKDLEYTVNYSEISKNTSGEAIIGWLPITNGQFKKTEPRYFGSTGYKAYYNRIPTELSSKIKVWSTYYGNMLELTKDSKFFGEKQTQGGNQNYIGVDTYVTDRQGQRKKFGKFLWAYEEIEDPQHPGQYVPRVWYGGLYNLPMPDDLGACASLDFGSRNPNGAYSSDDPPRVAFWKIDVFDDVTTSPTFGQTFPVIIESFKQPTGYSTQGALFFDARLIDGVTPSPIPNSNNPKRNSTPSGWGGRRNPNTNWDTVTTVPFGLNATVNFGEHGLNLYYTDAQNLDRLCELMWSTDLIQRFKNVQYSPSTGIVSINKLPIIPDATGSAEVIKYCGTRATGTVSDYETLGGAAHGNLRNVTAYGVPCDRGWQHTSSTLYIPPFFNSFLDFEPYTKISIRLPFIGTVAIPTNSVMGGWMFCNYLIDCLTGNCVAQIYARSMRNDEESEHDMFGETNGYHLIGQYSGNCALPMAITGDSTGAYQTVGAITGFASNAAGSLIGGVTSTSQNPWLGAAGSFTKSAVDFGLQMATIQHQPQIIGSLNANISCLSDLTCRVFITRPWDVVPGKWEDGLFTGESLIKQAGLESFSGGKVSQYDGMTRGLILGNIEGASEAEMNEIRAQFAGGVIL